MNLNRQLIISCEHAGNEVPEPYKHLFESDFDVLNTHRAIDIGAMELTGTISDKMRQEAYIHTVSRLLVDLNRSVDNPSIFSEFVSRQSDNLLNRLLEDYYQPHRNWVESRIAEVIGSGKQALHLSVHTFTPVLDGRVRDVDIGFLYDPERTGEKEFCRIWKQNLRAADGSLRLKMNRPYHGTMDGFSSALRKKYTGDQYLGIEIEVNQKFPQSAPAERWQQVQDSIARSLQAALKD